MNIKDNFKNKENIDSQNESEVAKEMDLIWE
jgi:hypothetical protein